MNTFKLKVIAHDKIFFDGEATSVFVPAMDGMMQFLAYHENAVVAIQPGDLRLIDADGKEYKVVCGDGFMEFRFEKNECEVMVETVLLPEEVDIKRAEEAKARAQERLRQKQSILEYQQSKAALARAMARLKAANNLRN